MTSFFIQNYKEKPNWKDFTLIVSAVSVGNVGQLTADLFISTFWMDRVGYLYDDSFLPIAGNDPFAVNDTAKNCNIVTPAEVFQSTDLKLVCVQQRSPLIKGKQRQYIDKLFQWIEESCFKQVIILTSSFAHERSEQQLTGTQLRYLASKELLAETGSYLTDSLKWVELEARPVHTLVERGQKVDKEAPHIYIPGGGIAKQLYLKCCDARIPTLLSLTFCSEGDNAIDAIQLATFINSWYQWIDLKKAQELSPQNRAGWKVPSSWKLMFGSSFEQTLFF